MTGSKEYRTWHHMVDRCTKPNRSDASCYFDRGIRVFPEWLGPGGFEKFLSCVGLAPSKRHSLDRIDNDLDYKPGNVHWATKKEQARNRRGNRFVAAFGFTRTIAEWSEITGFKSATIINRLALKWPVDVVLTKPLQVGSLSGHSRRGV